MTVVCIGASAARVGVVVHTGCASPSEGEAAEGAMEGDETLRRLRGLPSVVRWDTSLWGMTVRPGLANEIQLCWNMRLTRWCSMWGAEWVPGTYW
jgi:hypothetical protein